MKLFLQFFWIGMSKLLMVIMAIISVLIPGALGIYLIILFKKIMNLFLAILIGIILTIIGYCILYIIYHSVKAVKYCKKTGTDSLKKAWEKTATDWDWL